MVEAAAFCLRREPASTEPLSQSAQRPFTDQLRTPEAMGSRDAVAADEQLP